MRKAVFIVAACLISGAILNLAVAWACAAWVSPFEGTPTAWSVALNANDAGAASDEDRFLGFSRSDGFGHARINRHVFRWLPRQRPIKAIDGETVSSNRLRALGNTAPSAPIERPPGVNVEFENVKWITLGNTEWSEIRAGWPMRSFYCRNYAEITMRTPSGSAGILKTGFSPIESGVELPPFGPQIATRAGGSAWRALPYAPIWLGTVINTLFYAFLIAAPFIAFRQIRRARRRRRGLCRWCTYPIGTSDICTECGRAAAASSR